MAEEGSNEGRGRFEARRQRRIARRRREILAAAARVFADKGCSNATIREIADAANIAEGTLYNYFDGKRDILLAIMNETQERIETMLQDANQLQGREDIVALAERGYDIVVSQLPFTQALLLEAWTDDLILRDFAMDHLQSVGQRLQVFIAKRIEDEAFRSIDPALAARAVLGMFVAPILPVLRGIAPVPSAEKRRAVAEAAVDLLLDGIRVRVG